MKSRAYKFLLIAILILFAVVSTFTIILFWNQLLLVKIILVLSSLFGYSKFYLLYKTNSEEEWDNDWFEHALQFGVVCSGFALLLAFSS